MRYRIDSIESASQSGRRVFQAGLRLREILFAEFVLAGLGLEDRPCADKIVDIVRHSGSKLLGGRELFSPRIPLFGDCESACQADTNRPFELTERVVERLERARFLNQRQGGRRVIFVDIELAEELKGIEVIRKLRQQPARGGFEIGGILPAPMNLHQHLIGGQVAGGEPEALFQAGQNTPSGPA